MSCSNIVSCLGEFCSCADSFVLDIISPYTGMLTMYYEFNGTLNQTSIEVTETENIAVPNLFNEDYTTIIWFVLNNQTLNDTKYSIQTKVCNSSTMNPQEEQYDHTQYSAFDYK